MDLHLCSADPCTSGEDDMFHVMASAIIPRVEDLDLQEAAGRGPLGRCMVATKFWGCQCAPFTMLWRLLKNVLTCCGMGCCSRRRRKLAYHGPSGSSSGLPKHDDSETESEAEGGAHCQADQVAFHSGGKHTPLSATPCRDVACGTVKLLTSDANRSNKEELVQEEGQYSFGACNHHRALYESNIVKRKCAVDECYTEARTNKDGLRLCKLHATKEERVRFKPSVEEVKPPTSEEGGLRVLEEVASGPRVEPEARSAPGLACEKEVTRDPQLLAVYVKAVLQGVPVAEAVSITAAGRDDGLPSVHQTLKETAAWYVPRLPNGYPPEAKKALISLLSEEAPQTHPEVDPILQIQIPTPGGVTPQVYQTVRDTPTFRVPPTYEEIQRTDQRPQAFNHRGAGYYEEAYLPDRGAAPPRDEGYPDHKPSAPPDTPSFGWQSLYRPKGVQGLPSGMPLQDPARPRGVGDVIPPQAQQSFAWASRPRHLGAFTDAEPKGMDETAKALQTIARTLSSRDDAAGQERGKISSIGKTEERMVYLLRGCDNLTVPVAQATVGKELHHALKGTATQGRPMLRAIQFPVNLNNRVAFGLASLSLGGKDVKALPDYCLSAADFPLTSEEDFDGFVGTTDNKLERRPKPPMTLSQWYRNALRQAWAVSCVMGTEHYSSFEAAATYLLKLGEEHSYMWPPQTIYNVWEELWARFVEELRELDRVLRRNMREESPTFERIRFFATAPNADGDPWLQLPRTFYVEDSSEYFQCDIVPRHNRMLSRACWQTALKKGAALGGQRAGGEEQEVAPIEGPEAATPRPDPKVGKTALKPDSPKLHGPPLSGKEGARSLDHRPKERKTGKYLCWDHISHRGCKMASCPHAHVSPPKWDSLDWSVQLQILRRGGLKSKPAPTPAQLLERMDELRKSVKDKQADNVAEGKKNKADRQKAGRKPEEEDGSKVGQQPPEEFLTYHPTDQEARLLEWTEGGGETFHEDAHRADFTKTSTVTIEELPSEAVVRKDNMDDVDRMKLEGFESETLGRYVRNHLLRKKEDEPTKELKPDDVKDILVEAVRSGPPEVAAEADRLLADQGWSKVGDATPKAELTDFAWEGGVGRASLTYRGHTWEVSDYGDKLPTEERLRDLLGEDHGEQGAEEIRQCLVLHCTAGVLATQKGRRAVTAPSLKEVQEAAGEGPCKR